MANIKYGSCDSTLTHPNTTKITSSDDWEKMAKKIPVEDWKKVYWDFQLNIGDDGGLDGLKSLYFEVILSESGLKNLWQFLSYPDIASTSVTSLV